MSRQIQFRRGTADEHKNFTGAEGEITVDLTNKTLRVHDGVTAGGTMLARQSALDAADYVIAWQTPTAENNYTWYRKYKSGWVEQGGQINSDTIIFPIPFSSTLYTISAIPQMLNPGVGDISICYVNQSQTGINIQVRWNGGAQDNATYMWKVCGF